MRKQDAKIDIISVAKAAGVSPSTVSRSFNHPELVRPATRKTIAEAVRNLGYIRNRAAQTMHGKRSGTIGLIVPSVNNAIFSELIQSFSDIVEQEGFTILISTHGFDLRKEYEILRKLLEHRVDGIAIIGLDHLDETYQLLTQQKIPAIAIWNYEEDSRISCIGAENYDAGWQTARHLVDLGHRQIGMIFPSMSENDRARARLRGAMGALDAAGITVPKAWVTEAPYSVGHAKQACMDLLAISPRPTAILCANDIIAHGAIHAANRLGLRIPQEISIIGIGDFPGSAEMEPALTTMRIPAKRIGGLAGSHLVATIAGERPDEVLRSKFDVELVVRATTAPPAGDTMGDAMGGPVGEAGGDAVVEADPGAGNDMDPASDS